MWPVRGRPPARFRIPGTPVADHAAKRFVVDALAGPYAAVASRPAAAVPAHLSGGAVWRSGPARWFCRRPPPRWPWSAPKRPASSSASCPGVVVHRPCCAAKFPDTSSFRGRRAAQPRAATLLAALVGGRVRGGVTPFRLRPIQSRADRCARSAAVALGPPWAFGGWRTPSRPWVGLSGPPPACPSSVR